MAKTPAGASLKWARNQGTKWVFVKPDTITFDPWKILMLFATLYFLFTGSYTNALWTLALYSFFGFKLTFQY